MKKFLLLVVFIPFLSTLSFGQCQASFTHVVNGLSVDFTNTSSSDSSLASQWQWSFGDGNFSVNNDPSHTYASPGTYYVCLFWVDFNTCPTTPTMQWCDSVTVSGNPCQASFTYIQNGSTFNFTNTSTSDSSNASQWQWSFGDGNFSGDNDPSHTYAGPGTYYVCLFWVDFNACPTTPTMQYCDSVTVFPVGLKEHEKPIEIKLYPNPIEHELNLSIDANSSAELLIRFYDVLGKEIYRQKYKAIVGNNTLQLDASRWKNGAYFVAIENRKTGLIQQLKFIK